MDFPASQRLLLTVTDELNGLSGQAVEHIINEAVHDRHRLLGDPNIGMDLLEDLINVPRLTTLVRSPRDLTRLTVQRTRYASFS